ncbi:unnamed protein product, partial [Ectocarpus sp. 12 AP-2014]
HLHQIYRPDRLQGYSSLVLYTADHYEALYQVGNLATTVPTSLSAAHSPVISNPPAASTCDVPVASNAPGTVVTSATNLPMAATRDVPVSNNAPDTVVTVATDLPTAST